MEFPSITFASSPEYESLMNFRSGMMGKGFDNTQNNQLTTEGLDVPEEDIHISLNAVSLISHKKNAKNVPKKDASNSSQNNTHMEGEYPKDKLELSLSSISQINHNSKDILSFKMSARTHDSDPKCFDDSLKLTDTVTSLKQSTTSRKSIQNLLSARSNPRNGPIYHIDLEYIKEEPTVKTDKTEPSITVNKSFAGAKKLIQQAKIPDKGITVSSIKKMVEKKHQRTQSSKFKDFNYKEGSSINIWGNKLTLKENQEPSKQSILATNNEKILSDKKLPLNQILSQIDANRSSNNRGLSQNLIPSKKSDSLVHHSSQHEISLNSSRLNKSKTQKKSIIFDHADELLKKGQMILERKFMLSAQVNAQELKECTFKPKINPLTAPNSPKKLDSSDTIEKSQRMADSKEKYMSVAEKDDEINCTYKPKITKTSKRIMDEKRNEEEYIDNVYLRLYQRSKSGPKLRGNDLREGSPGSVSFNESFNMTDRSETGKYSNNFTFHPSIRPRSKKMKRSASASELLYADAVRRMNKSASNRDLSPQQPIFTLSKSNEYVAKRLIKEFETHAEQFFEIGREHKFTFTEMYQFLKLLYFVKNYSEELTQYDEEEKVLLEEMWMILHGDIYNGVNERNLLVFLLAILGLNLDIPGYVQGVNFPVSELLSNKADNMRRDLSNSSPVKENSERYVPISERIKDIVTKYVDLKESDRSSKNQSSDTKVNPFTIGDRGDSDKKKSLSTKNSEKLMSLSTNRERSRWFQIPCGTFDKEENIEFTDEEVEKIAKIFDTFYMNRLYYSTILTKIAKKLSYQDMKHSFQPKICPKSRRLAENHRNRQLERAANVLVENKLNIPNSGKLSHAELLNLQKLSKLKSNERLQYEKFNQEMKLCTFTPTLMAKTPKNYSIISKESEGSTSHRGEKLYQDAIRYNSRMRDGKSSDEIEYEKSLNHLTFQPSLTKRKLSSNDSRRSNQENAKGVEQLISRMQKGRESRKNKQQILEFRNYQQTENKNYPLMKFDLDCSNPNTPNKNSKRSASNKKLNTTIKDALKSEDQSVKMSNENSKVYFYQNRVKDSGLHHDESSTLDQTKLQKPNPHVDDFFSLERQKIASILNKLDTSQKIEVGKPSSTLIQKENFQSEKKLNEKPIPDKPIEKLPLLFVDVSFEVGKVERITVNEGDTAEALAEAFAAKHNLKEEMKRKLKILLESHMSKLLTRIEEEAPLSERLKNSLYQPYP